MFVAARGAHVGELVVLSVVHAGTEFRPGREIVRSRDIRSEWRRHDPAEGDLPDGDGDHGGLALGHARQRVAS